MIVSTIRQFGLRLRADPEEIPFQYSANVQMKFEKDENYSDYTVVGYYIPPGENEAKLLSINDDGTFTLGPDCFKNRGTLSFSFNLVNSIEEVHLGSIDFDVRHAFGDSSAILPEPEEVWISVVTKVAEDAIKEDVELVKQKAKEASQSALTASEKANEALKYANNAKDASNSAITAKDDAIAASNSASQFSDTAEKSAIEAKNSADNALKNANASNKAIEAVNQIKTQIEDKANEFDTNYQEKQNAFNQSVTSANNAFDNKVNQANSDLDAKVQEANTIIDEKVKTATEQAQKATNEADRATQATDGKLDKNLGVENAGKSLVVGENGEVVCGESGINEDEVNKIIDKAIDEKLYTQEEVDYMLADKMDKPYVPIEITDNATITDALAGNFKIDKIKGNTYQNVETNIAPTPNRPVPINSRKVLANGEYVELRSLKESKNLFDKNIMAFTSGTLNSDGTVGTNASYAVSGFVPVGPSTQYTIKVIDGFRGSTKVYYDINKQVISNEAIATFTTPSNCYFVRWQTATTDTRVLTEEDIQKINDEMMMVEGDSLPSSYVAPTVRDYKIVDHTTQTSKIVRNINQFELPTDFSWNDTDYYPSIFGNILPKDKKGVFDTRDYSLMNYTIVQYFNYSNVSGMYLGFSECDTYWKLNNRDEVNAFLTRIKEDGKPFLFQYQLAMPVEETITYVETDTSEVGYSWQDTTSPSPTIPSEVKGVEEIDILKTGKNLFDIEGHEFTTNLQRGKTDNNRIVKVNNTTLRIQNPNVNNYAVGDKFVVKANEPLIISFDVLEITGTEQINVVFYKEIGSLLKSFEYRTIKVGTRFVIDTPITTRNNYVYIGFQSVGAGSIVTISNILLEHASIATAYEPYTGQRVNITPPQPLYSTVDGNIADEVDVEKGVYRYWLLKDKIENLATAVNIAQKHGNFQSYFITKVKDNSLKPITLLGNEDTRNLICNKCNVNLLDYNNKKETFSLYVDKSAVFVGNINIERLNENTTSDIYNFIKDFEIVYPLENPIEIPIPQEDLKLLKSLKTEQGVTNIFVGGEVKPIIEARYPRDLALVQQQLEQKVLLMSENLTATQAKLLLQGGN